jgi:hypothetical protein
MAKQAITFVIDSDRDRDVLRWLEAQNNKSAAIRGAIRTQLSRGLDITLADIYEAIQDPRQGGWVRGSPSVPQSHEEVHEPADIAAALDGLGL